MAKVGFGTFFGFLGSRRMVSGTKRARLFINLSPVGNLTGSIFQWAINREKPYGKSWVWHVFWIFLGPAEWSLGPREAGFSSFYPL